jgi:hypothetical protein
VEDIIIQCHKSAKKINISSRFFFIILFIAGYILVENALFIPFSAMKQQRIKFITIYEKSPFCQIKNSIFNIFISKTFKANFTGYCNLFLSFVISFF